MARGDDLARSIDEWGTPVIRLGPVYAFGRAAWLVLAASAAVLVAAAVELTLFLR